VKNRIALMLATLLAATLLFAASTAGAKVRVAASTTDLASIASSVGGDDIEIFAIARPTSDPHRVEALTSYMVKVARAQVYLKVGLGLDQWADAIIDGSRNSHVEVVDCSRGVNVLEKPTGKVDASMGDVHPDGNPHYWLDPRNAVATANDIADGLAKVDAANAAKYHARAEAFGKEAQAAYEKGRATVKDLPSHAIFTYHKSWSYLADAFGFDVVSTVEPVPGIPPTAHHLAELVQTAKARKVAVLIQEPYFSADAGKFLARDAGLRPVTISSSCDGPEAGSYLAHVQAVLTALAGGK